MTMRCMHPHSHVDTHACTARALVQERKVGTQGRPAQPRPGRHPRRRTDMQACTHAGMHACRHARMQACTHARMQEHSGARAHTHAHAQDHAEALNVAIRLSQQDAARPVDE